MKQEMCKFINSAYFVLRKNNASGIRETQSIGIKLTETDFLRKLRTQNIANKINRDIYPLYTYKILMESGEQGEKVRQKFYIITLSCIKLQPFKLGTFKRK